MRIVWYFFNVFDHLATDDQSRSGGHECIARGNDQFGGHGIQHECSDDDAEHDRPVTIIAQQPNGTGRSRSEFSNDPHADFG